MDAELLRLAQEAVTALQLQAAGSTRWVEIAQLAVSGVGLGCIVGGLFSMKAAGKRRDREIDILAENMRESTRVVGQALERQGAAMTKALERQGEVLAELLRRTA